MKKHYFKNFLFSILTTWSFFINSTALYNEVSIKNIFKVETIVILFCFIFIYYFYSKLDNKKIGISKKILSIFFSIMIVLGNSFIELNSWNLVFGNALMIIISTISIIGYYILFSRSFVLLDNYINNYKSKDIDKKKQNKFLNLFDEKPFLVTFIVLSTILLIYFIAFYPLVLSPDPNYQILQYFGIPTKYVLYSDYYALYQTTLTNHHPIFHTLLLGKCIEIGRFILNDNFGLFIYSFLQSMTLILTLSYTILFLKNNGVSKKYRLIVLIIYAFVPMYMFYAISTVKDTFYTSFVILYIIMIIDYLKTKEISLKRLLYLFLIMIFISLFRNNGAYLILLSFPFMVFYDKKNIKKLGIIFTWFIIFYFSFQNVILPYFKIKDSGVQELLSIPFQQTARYVKESGDNLTDEEIKTIDKLLNYETLATRYNPNLSDNVKKHFNEKTTKEDLSDYFKVWSRGLLKRPDIYFQATFNNVYGYLTPNSINWYIYASYHPKKEGSGQVLISDSNLVTDHWPNIDYLVDYKFNRLTVLRNILRGYGEAFPYIPLVGLLSNIGFNSWVLLILSVYLFNKRNKKYIIALIPLYITLLTCLVGPANTYFRYAMPYVFIMPFLITLFIHKLKLM